jgi:hypothetical protein
VDRDHHGSAVALFLRQFAPLGVVVVASVVDGAAVADGVVTAQEEHKSKLTVRTLNLVVCELAPK